MKQGFYLLWINQVRLLAIFVIGSIFSFYTGANTCPNWFKNAGLKAGEDCLLKCVSIETDMGTFHCPDMCDQLCAESIATQMLFNTSGMYASLTKAEQALSAKYPKKAIKAYILSQKAEKICYSMFNKNKTNDVSDACRHFMWSALLYEKFGSKFSSTVLDTHESDPKQPKQERAMDISNNLLGLTTAEKILTKKRFFKKKRKKLKEKVLIKAFQKHLKKGNVIVLEKSNKNK